MNMNTCAAHFRADTNIESMTRLRWWLMSLVVLATGDVAFDDIICAFGRLRVEGDTW